MDACKFVYWFSPLIVGGISFLGRLLFRIDKPGDIFVIIVTEAGTTFQASLDEMPQTTLYVTFGVLVSVIMGYVTLRIEGLPEQSFSTNFNIINRVRQDLRIVVDSFYYSGTLFFATYLNLVLG